MNFLELPIRPQQTILSYTQYALPLCVIISEKRYHPWVLEKFAQIKSWKTVSKSGNHFQYVIFRGEDICYEEAAYTDVMDITKVQYDISEEFIEAIEDNIYSQNYFHCELDEFYMPCKEAHGKTHLIHPSIFYGFDRNSSEFLGVGFIKGGKFGKFRLYYRDFIKALKSKSYVSKEHNIDSHESMDAYLYKLKPIDTNYEFESDKLVALIESHLNSISHGKMVGGVATYDVVLNNLQNPTTPHRYIKYNTTHFMYEHTKMFGNAISYVLKNHGNLQIFSDLLEAYKKVIDLFEHVRFMHIDFAVKQGAWPYVAKEESAGIMFEKIKQATDCKVDVLSKILKRFPG